jgi:hypothetical protein
MRRHGEAATAIPGEAVFSTRCAPAAADGAGLVNRRMHPYAWWRKHAVEIDTHSKRSLEGWADVIPGYVRVCDNSALAPPRAGPDQGEN